MAALRRWLAPALAVALVGLAALWLKAGAEAGDALAFADTHGAGQGDAVVSPELIFAAMQRAPGGGASEATGRLAALGAEHPQVAARAVVAASSGARALGRPHEDTIEATAGAREVLAQAEATVPTPSGPWRLLAALALALWLGAAAGWIVRGHDPEGAPTPARWPWATATALGFAAWCAASFLM